MTTAANPPPKPPQPIHFPKSSSCCPYQELYTQLASLNAKYFTNCKLDESNALKPAFRQMVQNFQNHVNENNKQDIYQLYLPEWDNYQVVVSMRIIHQYLMDKWHWWEPQSDSEAPRFPYSYHDGHQQQYLFPTLNVNFTSDGIDNNLELQVKPRHFQPGDCIVKMNGVAAAVYPKDVQHAKKVGKQFREGSKLIHFLMLQETWSRFIRHYDPNPYRTLPVGIAVCMMKEMSLGDLKEFFWRHGKFHIFTSKYREEHFEVLVRKFLRGSKGPRFDSLDDFLIHCEGLLAKYFPCDNVQEEEEKQNIEEKPEGAPQAQENTSG